MHVKINVIFHKSYVEKLNENSLNHKKVIMKIQGKYSVKIDMQKSSKFDKT